MLVLTALGSGDASTKAGEPDSTKFRIQDYIPERFTDFGWKLEGGTRLMHNYSDGLTYYQLAIPTDMEIRNRETEVGKLDLSSNWLYRFETRHGLLDLAWGFGFDVDWNKGSETYEADYVTDEYGQSVRKTQHDDFISTANLAGEARRYLLSDFFASGELTTDFRSSDARNKLDRRISELDYNSDSTMKYISREEHSRREHFVNKELTLEGELRFGWGRVYEGRHSATALFLTRALADSDMLVSPLNQDQMSHLAEFVHRYRLRHAIDERENRADALRAVLDYFQSQQAVTADSTAALLVVEDVWDYYPTYSRRFGYAISFGFGGRDHYKSIHNGTDERDYDLDVVEFLDSAGTVDTSIQCNTDAYSTNKSEFTSSDYFVIRCEYYRPLSTNWQFNFIASGMLYINKPDSYDESDHEQHTFSSNLRYVALSSGLRYIYDARTDVLLSGTLNGKWKETTTYTWYTNPFFGSYWGSAASETRECSLELGAQVSFRISVPTLLQVRWIHWRNLGDVWTEAHMNSYTSHGFDLSAGITHWLF